MFNIILTQIRLFWKNSKINYSVSDQHCEGGGIGCHQVTTQYCQQKSPSGEILNDVRNVKLSEKEFFKCTNGPTSRKSWFSYENTKVDLTKKYIKNFTGTGNPHGFNFEISTYNSNYF